MKIQQLSSYVRRAVDDYHMIEEGDKIRIDINKRTLDLLVDETILEARRAKLKPFMPKHKSGYLAKYTRFVQDASHGAIV